MRAFLLVLLLSGPWVAAAQTRTVVIDESTPGTVSDGILDGFPGLHPKDGTPDFGGNALAVALKAGVTEERAVVEFPLAPLTGVAPDDVTAATLTFNVDDVLSTLGPGTEFNGKASDTILLHLYDGDGKAALGDFNRTGEAAITVSTGAAITDATLNAGGAVGFSVDVRARLLEALGAGTPFLGALLRTNDSPTGTSLDNLGEGSSGPPGARNSRLPFLTVEIADAPPPPGCGNGTLDAGESCDDANNDDGDCCSRTCTFEAAGSACRGADACIADETCDGAGTCSGGGPRSCDDQNPCTVDSCDPATGCVNDRTPDEGAACDDGNPCTLDDVCGGGVCGGSPLCGNGRLDPGCNEECDDGNLAPADGCSRECRVDTIVGGRGKRECLLRIALGSPVRGKDGTIAPIQTCKDNDPTCDDDPTPGTCGFVLAACTGLADARVPTCAAVPSTAASVIRPGRGDVENRTRLDAALDAMGGSGCTEPVRIDVALKKRGTRPGKRAIILEVRSPDAGKDRDTLRLVCRP